MSDVFYLVTTSVRYEDVIHHLDIYKPDIFVYCLKNESRDDLIRIMEHKRRLTRDGVVTVIVGTQEDCENFQKVAIYMEDLVLAKPISASGIKEKILEYMEDVEKEKEEQKLLQEKLAAVKAKDERKHVLVIDDDPIMLKLIKEHLHDISVTGYDGIHILSQYEPRLTTVRQNTVKIVQVAAEKLMDCIENPLQTVKETIVIETELEKGRTVGRVFY